MRKLTVSTFVSLDGVMQAPGGPEEDPTGGFALGGWMAPYFDEAMDFGAAGFDGAGRDLVLGRRTYEIFAAYWPYQGADDPTTQSLNAARKHVASRTLASVDWENSTLLPGDAAVAVAALKAQPGPDLQVIGSGDLVQSLHGAALVDEFHVWTFPVVLGRGKRLFEATARPCSLRLTATKTSASGTVMSTYVPAGDVVPGTFETREPSARECERRERMATGRW
jgi:dihydrofolate reductase